MLRRICAVSNLCSSEKWLELVKTRWERLEYFSDNGFIVVAICGRERPREHMTQPTMGPLAMGLLAKSGVSFLSVI